MILYVHVRVPMEKQARLAPMGASTLGVYIGTFSKSAQIAAEVPYGDLMSSCAGSALRMSKWKQWKSKISERMPELVAELVAELLAAGIDPKHSGNACA